MITVTQQTLNRLIDPCPCGILIAREDAYIFCGKSANWSIDGVPICQHDIAIMAGMNDDNEEFLKPALQERAA